jgi:hypothetical protein
VGKWYRFQDFTKSLFGIQTVQPGVSPSLWKFNSKTIDSQPQAICPAVLVGIEMESYRNCDNQFA